MTSNDSRKKPQPKLPFAKVEKHPKIPYYFIIHPLLFQTLQRLATKHFPKSPNFNFRSIIIMHPKTCKLQNCMTTQILQHHISLSCSDPLSTAPF